MSKKTYKTGDKPGKGSYQCLKCGKVITLSQDSEALPVCPVCKYTEWKKLS